MSGAGMSGEGMSAGEAEVDPAALRRQIATTLMPGFAGTTLPEWLAQRLRDGLGAVCIFGPNIVSWAQLRDLTDDIRAANPLAVIAIDEEGGDVTRLYYDSGSPYPGNAILGRLDDIGRTKEIGRMVGWELRAAGCTMTFAPDVDINSNPDNPVIGVRSFGTVAERVGAHGAAWVSGLQSTGIAASPKHFPGHGDTAQDSHLAVPIVDVGLDELRLRELLPFRAAIAAGAKTVMTSHILLPRIDQVNPATLSRRIVQGLLRDELGFDGVIVTDALDMTGASGVLGIAGAAATALAAGCDLLCIGTANTDAQLHEIEERVLAAIDAGELTRARVAEAAGRVLALAEDSAAAAIRIPIPEYIKNDEPEFDLGQISATFEVGERGNAWLADPPRTCSVIRLDTVANIAVGGAPWGPFAELVANPTSQIAEEWGDRPIVACTGRSDSDVVLASFAPVLVVGKDNHRHAWASELIDRLRAEGREVLVVDMGWPSDDRAYADIATFGASRLVGRSLLNLLSSR